MKEVGPRAFIRKFNVGSLCTEVSLNFIRWSPILSVYYCSWLATCHRYDDYNVEGASNIFLKICDLLN